MRLVFLGTSSGAPTAQRNVTSQALRFDDGSVWLLDCGEGTQHRLLASEVKVSRIERILVTHLHGDHVFGLPGLLGSIGLHGRTAPLEVVGPVGVKAFAEHALRLSDSHVPYPLTFTELERGGELGLRGTTGLSAWPLVHRAPCFGYVVREAPSRGRLDPDRAVALGVPRGPALGELVNGRSVRLADGREVTPADVLGPPRAGRVVVLLGDTCDPSAIAAAAEGCDLLVHEATYDASRADQAKLWGHSTAAMAGAFAAKIGARRLAITHFSARYDADDGAGSVADLVREAREFCPSIEVVAASDLLGLDIPTRE